MNNTKKLIGSRINSALALRGMKQKELAKILGVTDNTVSYYVSGARTPNAEQIIAIANALDVSADYLLGLTDTKAIEPDIKMACETTGLTEQAVRFLEKIQKKNNDYLNFINILLPYESTKNDFGTPLEELYLYCSFFDQELEEQILDSLKGITKNSKIDFHSTKKFIIQSTIMNQIQRSLDDFKNDYLAKTILTSGDDTHANDHKEE